VSAKVLVPGDIVAGKYSIKALLKSDGAVATYHAIVSPNRDVALKVFDPRLLADPMVTHERAQTMTRIGSVPASLALPVIEHAVVDEGSTPYIATELSSHPSLAQLVALCPLTLIETVTILRNVGRALDYAQRHGACHLALKPTNVFVGPPSAYQTHVVDFGATAAHRALAAKGVGRLRVAWLAPEQTDREGDARSDVFSAALVAFFAMTGRAYWRCAQDKDAEVDAWRAEIDEARVTASARATELGKSVDAAIDSVMVKALAKEPAQRHATVTELAEALAAAAGLAPAPPVRDSAPAFMAAMAPPPKAAPVVASPFSTPAPPAAKVASPFSAPAPKPPPAAPLAPVVAPEPESLDVPFELPSIPPAVALPAAAPLVPPPAQPLPVLASIAAAPTTDPPMAPRRRLGPIVAAVLAGIVVVVAIGVVLRVVFTKEETGDAPTATTSAPVAVTTTAPATTSAPAASTPPSATASAPADASAAPIASAAPDANAPSGADILVTCKPAACANVRVDGKTVDDPSTPVSVQPGTHNIAIIPPPGYYPSSKQVTVKADEHAKVTLVLTAARPAGPQPCGKFLKRCN
jgi:serine/threonine protein kinase